MPFVNQETAFRAVPPLRSPTQHAMDRADAVQQGDGTIDQSIQRVEVAVRRHG